MTNAPCTYCGEHHHYQHELICDNVRTLYPLWDSKAELKEAERIAVDYFTEEIKSLKNDYMILNTSRLNALEIAHNVTIELDDLHKQLKLAKAEIYRLKNPGRYFTSTQQQE